MKKKNTLVLVSMVVVICLLLSFADVAGYIDRFAQLLGSRSLTRFEDMEYTRPDMDAFQKALDEGLAQAQSQTKLESLLAAIQDFNIQYNNFYTAYVLSNIYYSKDLTDTHWENEYNFCLEHSAAVNSGLDSFYRALAKSPLRSELESEDYFGKDFFQSYEGESMYDETFVSLLQQEADLQSQYYAISAEAGAVEYYSEEYFTQYGSRMAEVYVQLIALRQEMARHTGYSSYPEFAYDFYFGRDYTCQQAENYLAGIQQELVPLYKQIVARDDLPTPSYSSQKATYTYVKTMATNMGGMVDQAFRAMDEAELFDIEYSAKKFNSSFEVFVPNYFTPYIFINPTQSEYDKLTFAHEFGHFCSDYASMGSSAGVDVAEVFSQGMEYLSLCYVEDQDLAVLKMVDSLSVYVEQSALAAFEHQVYSLEGSQLTAENIQALYAQVGQAYGLNTMYWDSRSYVCIPHFFVSPMYVISYVVSNDVALQLYIMEQAQQGQGLTCLVDNLTTQQSGIIAFVEEAGLTSSPFAEGWLVTVRQTLEGVLLKKQS